MGRIRVEYRANVHPISRFLSSLASAYDWQKMSGLNAKGLKKTEEKDDTYFITIEEEEEVEWGGKGELGEEGADEVEESYEFHSSLD